MEMVASTSEAAGRLFLEQCGIYSMSGFLVEPDLFVTCADFEPGLGTVARMKVPRSNLASMSNLREPESKHYRT